MKIVINACYGGFGLSEKAFERLIELGMKVRKYEKENNGEEIIDFGENNNIGRYSFNYDYYEEIRNNPLLVQVVEELGKEANGVFSKLKIVEIPDDVDWEIDEYDGFEEVHERHRTWG